MANVMKKKTIFVIGFWIILIILFIISHKILSKIILHYQQMPAIETKEAYQLISRYKLPVQRFYQRMERCPTMADKAQIIPRIEAYTYVKTIRLLADEPTKTCFITAVMREDTPSRDVKNRLIVIAYKTDRQRTNNWSCYTNINNIYTIGSCRDRVLPHSFLRALADYEKIIK